LGVTWKIQPARNGVSHALWRLADKSKSNFFSPILSSRMFCQGSMRTSKLINEMFKTFKSTFYQWICLELSFFVTNLVQQWVVLDPQHTKTWRSCGLYLSPELNNAWRYLQLAHLMQPTTKKKKKKRKRINQIYGIIWE